VTSYSYGGQPGDVTTITDPESRVTTMTYDAYGDVASRSISPSSRVTDTTSYAYDIDGEQTCQAPPAATASGVTCPAPGSAPVAGTTATAYNADGEVTSVTDPAGNTTSYRYDADGNRVQVSDPSGNTTTSTYDLDNRLLSTTVGANGTAPSTTTYRYDLTPGAGACASPAGATYCATVTNPNGGVRADYYNATGELIQQTLADGQTTQYSYDSAGNKTSMTDAVGRTTTYGYDADSRLTSVSYSDNTPNVTYTYDADGHRKSMTDGTGTTTYTYDADTRLTSVTNGHGTATTYGYNHAGDITSLTYPGSNTVTRSYDGAGRLASITDWLGNTASFGYDADGNLATTSYPNGDTVTSTYNAADMLTKTSAANGNGTLASISITRGADSLIKEETDSGALTGTTDYAYSAQNQLTSAGTDTYSYNPSGDLTSTPGDSQTFNAADQLTTSTGGASATTYTYDSNGDRVSATLSSGASTGYTYNQALELTTVTQATQPVASYTYNGDGLRMSQTTSGGTQQFTWDTSQRVPQVLADGSNDYIYGPDGLPTEQISTAGAASYFFHDSNGNTRALLDGSGGIGATFSYTPYGALASQTGTLTTPLLYGQGYTDAATGLVYLVNRYYDPATAQFLTVDPAVDQTQQPYAYASDDPLNAADPAGLSSFSFLGCAFGRCLALDTHAGLQLATGSPQIALSYNEENGSNFFIATPGKYFSAVMSRGGAVTVNGGFYLGPVGLGAQGVHQNGHYSGSPCVVLVIGYCAPTRDDPGPAPVPPSQTIPKGMPKYLINPKWRSPYTLAAYYTYGNSVCDFPSFVA
jgi:RHS repeat-associated protein